MTTKTCIPFHSTRGNVEPVNLETALARGLAMDGGLYVPERFPRLTAEDFSWPRSLPETAQTLLAPFFACSSLEAQLDQICEEAFNFPVPLRQPEHATWQVLELFHGPTAAFKDVGARFLAQCLDRLQADKLVLVATSGDTGGAVAAAMDECKSLQVAIAYPKGMVSARQEHQLTCWSDSVHACRIDADFDTCQSFVKRAFADAELSTLPLTSANSISIGRLLPQMVYYAHASLDVFHSTGKLARFVIPTGNLGNALAAVWARRIGLPIGEIVLATNANRTISRYWMLGLWSPEATVATLANAMDVSDPSNMERLKHLFPDPSDTVHGIQAASASDRQIADTIVATHQRHYMAICPHTATAVHALSVVRPSDGQDVIVATAHPAKFESIVEPLIGRTIKMPDALAELMERPTSVQDLPADYSAFSRALLDIHPTKT